MAKSRIVLCTALQVSKWNMSEILTHKKHLTWLSINSSILIFSHVTEIYESEWSDALVTIAIVIPTTPTTPTKVPGHLH